MPRTRLTRRRVLASLGATPLLPSFAALAEGDSSDAPRTETVLSALLHVDLATSPDANVGSALISGGVAQGLLAGTVHQGSLEWSRDPQCGVLWLAARFDIATDTGARLHVADHATVMLSGQGWQSSFPTSPEITLLEGAAACPEAVYLGRMDAREIHAGRLLLSVHRVL